MQLSNEIEINETDSEIKKPIQLSFSYLENHPEFSISKSGSIAMLDASIIIIGHSDSENGKKVIHLFPME